MYDIDCINFLFKFWQCYTLKFSETKISLNYMLKDPARTLSVIQTSQLMLYSEIIAVCSQTHTKHINTPCGHNVELLNVTLAVHIVTTGLQRVISLL